MVVQPVDGTPGHVFGHSLDCVVIGPAIPAIEVAFVFDKQVGGDGMKLSGHHARANVREQPPFGSGGECDGPQLRFSGGTSGPGSVSFSGYCGKTGSGSFIPFKAGGCGPKEAEFIKTSWMSSSMRYLEGVAMIASA